MKTARILLTIMGIIMCASIGLHAQNVVKPELTATIAGHSSGEIAKELLLSRDTIVCSDPKYVITRFTLSLVLKGDVLDMKCTGNVFTNLMTSEVKKLEPGAKIFIEDIVAKPTEGEEKKLAAMILKIK